MNFKKSKKLLNSVNLRNLLEYLWLNDWREVEESVNVYKVFQKKNKDQHFQLMVPLDKTYLDFLQKLNECLSILAASENQDVEYLINDIHSSHDDLLRVRFNSFETSDGTIPASQGVNFIKKAYEVLSVSAMSVEKKKSIYFGKKPSHVDEYLKKVKLGQTEKGSYVLMLKSPLPFVDQTGILGNDAESLFERKVIKNLMTSLKYVKKSTQHCLKTGSFDLFQKQVEKGVNSNLCQSLYELQSENASAEFDFSCKWAKNFNTPTNVIDKISFTAKEVPILKEAAKILREQSALDDYILNGIIVRLKSDNPDDGGEVIIRSYGDDEWRGKMIKVYLNNTNYHEANLAHGKSATVSCKGCLEKIGKYWQISNIKDFVVIPFDKE